MALIIVRHTTPDVAPGTCYGITDLDVTDAFLDEAEAVARALPRFDQIVSSPLQRCRKLAAFLSDQTDRPFTLDDRFREMDFGAWENRQWSDIPREELNAWAADFLDAKPHGGENVRQLRDRTRAGLTDLRGVAGVTLVVAHAGIMKSALAVGDAAADFSTDIAYGGFITL